MCKPWRCLAQGLTLSLFLAGLAQAAPLVNGSFETGDYSGWTLWESGNPTWGTWGIAKNEDVIQKFQRIFDYCDQVEVKQISSGLPRTYVASDGEFLALQLQTMNEDHRMYQDVALPSNAMALSWDMFYDNKHTKFERYQQLAVTIRDLDDNILETLFWTDPNPDNPSPLSIPMSNFTFDISQHAGQNVRIDVFLTTYRNFLDAGFDHFQILVADSPAPPAPPGWSKTHGKKVGWEDGDLPPGLSKQNKTPPGFEKGKKTGWGNE